MAAEDDVIKLRARIELSTPTSRHRRAADAQPLPHHILAEERAPAPQALVPADTADDPR
jgi:hypothetical protein